MKEQLSAELFGICFPCRVGLAAGTDRNAEHFYKASRRHYGFVEVGPLTALQQPSIYRRSKIKATRHPNRGIKNAILNLQAHGERLHRSRPVVSIDLTYSNACQDMDSVVREFERSYSLVYDFADMFTIDSAVTDDNAHRPLQDASAISDILDLLLDIRSAYGTYKPLIIKVAPDVPKEILHQILDYSRLNAVDAVLIKYSSALGLGSVLELLSHIREYTQGRFPVCVDCGILTADNISAALDAGADLVEGRPRLLRRSSYIVRILSKRAKKAADAASPDNAPEKPENA